MSNSKNRNKVTIGSAGLNDNKLNHLTIHLSYLFDRGVNFRDRVITLTDAIAYPMFDLVDAAMSEMEAQNRKNITIRIHSEGGSVYEALAILGRMEKSPCNITTEGFGAIMSAATLILAAGDKRRMSRLGWFMYHESSYGVEGRHSSMKDAVAQAEKEELQWAKVMAEYTGKPESYWNKLGKRKDVYLTAEQLLELGVIDEIF